MELDLNRLILFWCCSNANKTEKFKEKLFEKTDGMEIILDGKCIAYPPETRVCDISNCYFYFYFFLNHFVHMIPK